MNKLNSKLQPKIKENKCGEKKEKNGKKIQPKNEKNPNTHTGKDLGGQKCSQK